MTYIYVHLLALFADWKDFVPQAAELPWDWRQCQRLCHPAGHWPGLTEGHMATAAGICYKTQSTNAVTHLLPADKSTHQHHTQCCHGHEIAMWEIYPLPSTSIPLPLPSLLLSFPSIPLEVGPHKSN